MNDEFKEHLDSLALSLSCNHIWRRYSLMRNGNLFSGWKEGKEGKADKMYLFIDGGSFLARSFSSLTLFPLSVSVSCV